MKPVSILSALFLALAFPSASQSAETETFVLSGGETFSFVKVPGRNFSIGQTEVTQQVYEAIMEENPSSFGGENPAVDSVSWYDAVVFCNRLSIALQKVPAYSVNGSVNPDDWEYEPHGGTSVIAEVVWNRDADGFRLPTEEEWEYAAMGGEHFKYAGSDDLAEVAWYRKSSGFKPHDVASKKPNGYGIYDMCGNVWEWCWDKANSLYRIHKGGSWSSEKTLCEIQFRGRHYPSRNTPCYSYFNFGFRIARNSNGSQGDSK